jgi:hypothetical protein
VFKEHLHENSQNLAKILNFPKGKILWGKFAKVFGNEGFEFAREILSQILKFHIFFSRNFTNNTVQALSVKVVSVDGVRYLACVLVHGKLRNLSMESLLKKSTLTVVHTW